jgi:hypothetical protein
VTEPGAAGEPEAPAAAANKAATEAASGQLPVVSDTRARQIADPEARAEIARVEREHRQRDPAVRLSFADYEVTVTEKDDHFAVFYQYANPNPGFELWAGHGMHFTVYVDKESGSTRLIGGE